MTDQSTRAAASQSAGQLSRDVQDQIGRQLRAIYDEILEEPIPDRFVQVLLDLKRKPGGPS